MEKEKLYHIALDDYEHGVVIRSLNDEKTKLMEEGKSADAVDDLPVIISLHLSVSKTRNAMAEIHSHISDEKFRKKQERSKDYER